MRAVLPLRGWPALQRRTAPGNRYSSPVIRASQAGQAQSTQTAASQEGYNRFTVSLKKPLGLVLEEAKDGSVRVAEVTKDGAADRAGCVVGDQLIATSGVVYGTELDYAGVTVKGGQKIVRLLALGENFKTIGAAIRSHPGHMPVTLEFQRLQ